MASTTTTTGPPSPPFTRESAIKRYASPRTAGTPATQGRQLWPTRTDSRWRNRSEFINGPNEIIAVLSRKWAKELDYRLVEELWAFTSNRIAVRFAYDWHDYSGHSYGYPAGNENWELSDDGLMALRFASQQTFPIPESDRQYHWPLGRRPDELSRSEQTWGL